VFAAHGALTIHRWSNEGKYVGSWAATNLAYDFVVDKAGRVLTLALVDGHTRAARHSANGKLQDEMEFVWPEAVGPAPEPDKTITISAMAADRAFERLVAFHAMRNFSYACYLFWYDLDGAFVAANPIWRLAYCGHGSPRSTYITSNQDGSVATNYMPDSRLGVNGRARGVTQFDPQMAVQATTATILFEGEEEVWERARVSGAGPAAVLYPLTGVVAQLRPSLEARWRRQAPPYAMDLASSDEGLVAVRGWDGREGRVTLLASDGVTAWRAASGTPLATGIALDSRRVYVSDPISRTVRALDVQDGSPSGVLAPSGAPVGWPVDIAASLDDRLVTIDHRGTVEVWMWPDGQRVRAWRVRGLSPPLALDAANGLVGILHRDGSVEVWTDEGAFVDHWGPRVGRDLVDIAVDGTHAVTLLDAPTHSLIRYLPGAGEPEPFRRGEIGDGVCAVTGDKTASPSRVYLGGSVTVTLTLSGSCPAGPTMADVMLVADPRITFGYTYELARGQEALEQAVLALDPPTYRVGLATVVTGTSQVEIVAPLGSSQPRLVQAIRGFGRRYDYATMNGPDTVWPDLVRTAADHLTAEVRHGAARVLLFVGGILPRTSMSSAADFVGQGGIIKAVQLPEDHAPSLSDRLPEPRDVVLGAHAGDVAEIARRVQLLLDAGSIRDVTVLDKLAPSMEYVLGSARPRASWDSGQLDWQLSDLSATPRAFTYQVTPLEVGIHPVNEVAEAHYTDADGSRRAFVFPMPMVEVLAPTPTPTTTQAPTPTLVPTQEPSATAVPVPQPLYLPLALREHCDPHHKRADVALVIDTSSSMAGSKLEDAKAAAAAFVGQMDLAPGRDQVAVVRFDTEAEVACHLTSALAVIDAAIRNLTYRSGTHIDKGLRTALGELQSSRHLQRNNSVMILLTDGIQTGTPGQELRAAAEVRAAGVRLYTIGLGADVDASTLREMAGDAARYHFAPDSADLAPIYTEIASDITCPAPAGGFWPGPSSR